MLNNSSRTAVKSANNRLEALGWCAHCACMVSTLCSARAGLDRRARCHHEPIRFTQGKLREGSVPIGAQMLRCAQHDSQDTAHKGSLISTCLRY
jgi:hypothetical protein